MPKAKSKPRAAKKAKPKPAAKSGRAARAKKAAPKSSAAKTAGLDFNHAMIYARDVARSLDFYRGRLGFKLIEDFRYEGNPVYARLAAPVGVGTIALHQAAPGAPIPSEGVRLYFEIEALDDF